MPLANLYHFLIALSHFQFNTLWLVHLHVCKFFCFPYLIFYLCLLFHECN